MMRAVGVGNDIYEFIESSNMLAGKALDGAKKRESWPQHALSGTRTAISKKLANAITKEVVSTE